MKKIIIGSVIFTVVVVLLSVLTLVMFANATESATQDLPNDTIVATQNNGEEYIQKLDEKALEIVNDFEVKWDEDAKGFVVEDIKSDDAQINIPTSYLGHPIVGVSEGVLNNKSVDKVIIPEDLKVDDIIKLNVPTREGYTFIGWIIEIKDGLKIYIAKWKQTSIKYDTGKTAIKVNDTVSAELFSAVCYDSVLEKNLDVAIEATVIGDFEAGKVVSVKLSAKDCKDQIIEGIKIYGEPKIAVVDLITDETNINNIATVTDSFGEKLVADVTCDGELVGKSKVNVTVKATDAAGNTVENTYGYDVHSDKEDKNHLCDFCEKVLSVCMDENKDHKCDYCTANVGEHSDAKGDGDHLCEYCENVVDVCMDADKNHVCDECGNNVGVCADSINDGDHVCEYCNKKLTECVDSDKNHHCDECDTSMGVHADISGDGNHSCDYCGQASLTQCIDVDKNHSCDECKNGMGEHSDSDNDGNHLCDYCGDIMYPCVDEDKNHFCDECGAYIGIHADVLNDEDHLCEYCKGRIGKCTDDNNDHICDECKDRMGEHKDSDDEDHLCDVCNKLIEPCEDPDIDHECNECGAWVGEHTDPENDNDHLCDYCKQEMTECDDIDLNHYCDECNKYLGKHLDAPGDGDHLCEYCGRVASECRDENTDHYCDECSTHMGTHSDNPGDGNHLCEYCGKNESSCVDFDRNHACDECGDNVGEHKDSANDGNHLCDYCNAKITSCIDQDKNHYCDECDAYMGTHSDKTGDGDHLCEYCGKNESSCVDTDKNHYCDECDAYMGTHSDKTGDGDHLCEYCGKNESSCVDTDKNHSCDECGAYMGTHDDKTGDGDHLCEYCGNEASSCVDSDKNHVCEECGGDVGVRMDSPNDGDHLCDYCKKTLTSCSDSDSNGYCDECGKANSYTVHYNANGGTGTVSSSTHVYGTSKTLNANKFTRNGYIFAGWNTKSNGTGTDYANSASVKNLVSNGGSITLYAMWKVDPYMISKYVATKTTVSDTKGTNQYVVYTTIDSTPFTLTQNAIIDWSNENNTNLLEHTGRVVSDGRYNNIDISSSVSQLYFIGNSAKTYTNIRFALVNFKNLQGLKLTLHNFNFIADDVALSTWNNNGSTTGLVTLTIESVGYSSIDTSAASQKAVNIPGTVIFTGSGTLNIKGGDGASGSKDGGDGEIAVKVEIVTINMTGSINIAGGNGGAAQNRSFSDNAGNGSNGRDGYIGGNGGVAIKANNVNINSGVVGIAGGDGGRGGDASEGNSAIVSKHGGDGGAGGAGAVAIETDVLTINSSVTGTIQGGDGGEGGTRGGIHGNGTRGSQGVGGDGGKGIVYTSYKVTGSSSVASVRISDGVKGPNGTGTNGG